MKVVAIALFLAAIGIFYGAFFKLAPYLAAALPAGDWNKILTFIVYALIGNLGGIGIPLAMIVWAIMLFFIFSQE